MRAMDLHTVEAGCLANHRRGGETLDDVFDLSRCQLTRCGRAGKIEGHWARRHRGVSECQRVGLAPWVIELHPDRDTGVLGGLSPARQRVQVAFILDDDVAWLTELGAIDHHIAGDDQAVPTLAPARVEP